MATNLDLYRVFYSVATHGNISKAANELFISQPAVSKAICNLERSSGITLFSRNSRGVKLTKEGEVFYQYVKSALNQIYEGERVLTKLKNKEIGIIKVGISSILCKNFLVPRLKNFIQKYPQIKIIINNKTSSETLKLLDDGKVDIAIVSTPCDYFHYNFVEIFKIQDIFVASKGYINSHNIENLEDITSYHTLMLLEEGNVSRKYIDLYFNQNNIHIKPDIELSNMDLLVELAKVDLGITVAIKEFITNELSDGPLIELPIKPSIPCRSIVMLSHKSTPLSIASQAFWNYLINNSSN